MAAETDMTAIFAVSSILSDEVKERHEMKRTVFEE
jgi:hypothetical protein